LFEIIVEEGGENDLYEGGDWERYN
jgi:hypothetical protein